MLIHMTLIRAVTFQMKNLKPLTPKDVMLLSQTILSVLEKLQPCLSKQSSLLMELV